MLNPVDRRLLQENNALIVQLVERFDIHPQLVETNRYLKAILESLNNEADIKKLTDKVEAQTGVLVDAADAAKQ